MSFTVHHPRIPGVKVEGLSASERDAHKKAGWVSSQPVERAGEAPEEAATESTDDKPKRTRKK